MELLNYGYNLLDDGGTFDATKLHAYKSGTDMAAKGRVSRITDGLGRTTDISYAPLALPTVYQKEGDMQYPLIERTLPLSVVSEVIASNGVAGSTTTDYQYRGLTFHASGKGLLGFIGTTAANSALGTATSNTVTQWNTQKYVPAQTLMTTTMGDAMATSQTAISLITKGRNYFCWPATVTETDADGNISVTTNSYNTTLGVPTLQHQSFDNGATYRQIAYSGYVKKGWSQLPQTVTTTQKHPDDNAVYTTQQTFVYDSKGRIASTTQHAGTDMALTTAYTYDNFGNQLTAVPSGSGVTPVKTVKTYSTNGRLLASEKTEPSTDTTYYYYDNMDNLTRSSVSRANSLVSFYTYDGWGTILTSTSPIGVTTTHTEGWGPTAAKRYWCMEQTDGQPWHKTWYDECGREVLSESIGPDGMEISKAIAYDDYGRVTSVNNITGLLTHTETFAYDDRGRVTSDILSSGKTTTYSYGNRSVTTSENGHTFEKTFDAWGNVKTSTDPVSSVTYTYYSSGLPQTATCEGATVTMAYDQAGNRTEIDDPDAGFTTSTWSADGKMLSQTDARGVETSYEYNSLGLVSAQHIGSQTISTTYGTPLGSKLVPIQTAMNGNTIQYDYDSSDRVISQIRTLADGTTLSYSYAYNTLGQLSLTTYPGGVTIAYEYDSHGFCTQMTAGGQVVWRLASADGLRDSTMFCDSISYTSTRDANGMLSCQQWWHGTSSLSRKTYTFDGTTGNLLNRSVDNVAHLNPGSLMQLGEAADIQNNTDSFNSWPQLSDTTIVGPTIPLETDGLETYTYDALDRLTNVGGSLGAQTMTINYGSGGNILSKSSVGNYSYDAGAQPHAVIGVTNPRSWIPSATLETTFGQLNKIEMISNGTYETSFSYGPDLERWSTEETKNGSDYRDVLYADDYERVTMNGVTREFYYLGHGVIIMRQGGNFTPLLSMMDHLGSIFRVVDQSGNPKFNAYYDAWGQQEVTKNAISLQRGYCGHEMLPEYGLINMNGRLYDPLLGRFLSPDNYVQQPDYSQNFNRYTYCMNNPLKYTDPDGEIAWFVPVIAGAIIGAYTGASIQSHTAAFWQWSSDSWKGAIVGGVIGGAIGYSVSSVIYGFSPSSVSGFVETVGELDVLTKTAGLTGNILQSGFTNIITNALTGFSIDHAWKDGVVGLATGTWAFMGGFGMAKGFGTSSRLLKIASKVGYQMVGTAISSIGSNWADNQKLLSKVTLGVGPVNFSLRKHQRFIQIKENLGNIVFNALGVANMFAGGSATFNVDNLTFVYKGGLRDTLFKPDTGFGSYAIFMDTSDGYSSDTFLHEIHHLWQSRAMRNSYLQNYIVNGANSLLSGGKFIDHMNYLEQIAYSHEWY